MEDLLYNPVYNALVSGDAHLGGGTANVKFFDEAVSPFAGFPTDHACGFDDLFSLLPAGREILYARPEPIKEPAGWKFIAYIPGLQFVFSGKDLPALPAITPVPLDTTHVAEMVQLAKLTKPGPFGIRTIEFGHYHGVFENDRLVAMTGQRLHAGNNTEISAVCTHPDHLGKGYAATLLIHQLHLIHSRGQRAFLHVREDNSRAIALYERLGFIVQRPMHFYFMRRE